MPLIDNTASLRAGIQTALKDTWRQEWPVYQEQQKIWMHDLPWSTIRNASYGFKERVPFPKPWPYGKGRTRQMFRDRSIDVSLYTYDLTQIWSGWDEADDQLDGTNGIKKHVSMGTKRFLQIPDVLFTEYLTNVASFNPSLQLAYDGVALFSTVDGDGAARFGATGGNILIGGGASTTAAVINDIIAIRRRFLAFQEPTGQPMFSPDDIAYNKLHFEIPKELDGVFQRIAEQNLLYADPTVNTSTGNFLFGKIKYKVNQRLTDVNDWYAVLQHDYWKPMVVRRPGEVRHIFAEISNSDEARETNNLLSYADIRIGLGVWFPACAIKVSN